MGIIWIILIGLVAGLIARWLSPGPNNPAGSSSLWSSASLAHSWQPGSAKRLAGTVLTRVQALSAPQLVPCSSCSSGTGLLPHG